MRCPMSPVSYKPRGLLTGPPLRPSTPVLPGPSFAPSVTPAQDIVHRGGESRGLLSRTVPPASRAARGCHLWSAGHGWKRREATQEVRTAQGREAASLRYPPFSKATRVRAEGRESHRGTPTVGPLQGLQGLQGLRRPSPARGAPTHARTTCNQTGTSAVG